MISTYLAQNPTPLGDLRGPGKIGFDQSTPNDVFSLFPQIISVVIGFLTAVAILWFILQFFLGAIGIISAGGDQKSFEAARSRIFNALVGLIVVISALIFISVLGGVLGIDILNLRVQLIKLTP